MEFDITCVCGERVRVQAGDFELAVGPMVEAMDRHVAAAPHPQVPAGMSLEQREGMVRQAMTPAS